MKAEDFDKQIANKLKDSQVTPPDLVWDNIAQALQKPQQKTEKKRYPFYVRLSLAAAILICMGFALQLFLVKDSKDQQELFSENHPGHHPQNSTHAEQSIARNSAEQELLSTPELSQQIVRENKLTRAEDRPKQVNKDESIPQQIKKSNAAIHSEKKRINIVPPGRAYAAQQVQLSKVTLAANHQKPPVKTMPSMEVTYASNQEVQKQKPNLLVLVLNTLTQNINPTQKELSFNQDDEGTLQVDFSNSLVKN